MIGDVIKRCRERKGLSREQLGELIGTVAQNIYNYEKDKRCSLDMLVRLTEFLDFSIIIKDGKIFLEEESEIMEVNKNEILKLEDIIKEVTKDTEGEIIYTEQFLEVFIKLGYSLGESETIRRAFGKKSQKIDDIVNALKKKCDCDENSIRKLGYESQYTYWKSHVYGVTSILDRKIKKVLG